jgi:transcriptional/translational regulatory protein YebC/TACO1
VIVECLTDNKNRTGPNIRVLFRKGQLGAAGSVSWDFRHLGMIQATAEAGAADAEDAAIEAGAQEVEPGAGDDGATLFLTEHGDLDAVSRALAAQKWHVTSAVLGWKARNPVKVEGEARAEVEAFLHTLDEDDDVQHLYVGLE